MTSPEVYRELRSARPAASASLRARVRQIAATEATRPMWRRPRLRLPARRRALLALPLAAALALATAGVIGIAHSGREQTIAAERHRTPETTRAGHTSKSAPHATSAGKTLSAFPGIAPAPGRAQQVTATLTVQVASSDGVSRAAQDALDITRSLDGHIVNASVTTGEEASASLTARIPVGNVQEAIVRFSALGRINSQQVSIDDLQESLDALGRRTASLRAQIVRISARLETGSLDAETRAVLEQRRRTLRNELRHVRREIASTRAEARLSTIELGIVTPRTQGVVPGPSQFHRGLDDAVDVLVWEGVVGLGIALVAAPLTLVALTLWLLRRAVRRREEERLLAAS